MIRPLTLSVALLSLAGCATRSPTSVVTAPVRAVTAVGSAALPVVAAGAVNSVTQPVRVGRGAVGAVGSAVRAADQPVQVEQEGDPVSQSEAPR